jgi:hypothetical protein
MSWTDALKEFSKENGKFILPKKDTQEYARVKEIQARMAKEKDVPVDVKVVKAKAVKVENIVEVLPVVAEVAEVKPKAKKAKAVKVANDEFAVADEPVVAPESVKPKKVRKTIVKVANVADAKPDVVVVEPVEVKRKGPKLVDRGIRIVNKGITMSFD